MLTEKTIRNITKVDWKKVFSTNGFKNYSKPTENPGTLELKKYIENLYADSTPIEIEKLDSAIFNEITFNQPNEYRIEKLIVKPDFDDLEIDHTLSETLRINKKFNEEITTGGSKMKILTSRIYTKDSKLEKLILLIKVGESYKPSKFGVHNIFFTMIFDFKNQMLCIGRDKGNFDKYSDVPFNDVLSKLIMKLSESIFPLLKVDIDEYNDETLKRVIYSMYHELTKPIETKLEMSLPENANELISNLFEELGIELKEKYLKQIHSIIFQDYGDQESPEFKKGLYDNGWIFRFAFKDGDFTKANSRTEDRSPVYTSPVFWNLKELISSKNKLSDAGYVWSCDNNKQIQAKIDVHNKGFCVYLYSSNIDWGEERIEFIRTKIKSYL